MKRKPRILAICSSGGHWVQLRRLAPAFEGLDVTYACPIKSKPSDIEGRFLTIPDANRWNKRKLAWMIFRVSCLVFWHRPTHIISTGAAPGYIAIRVGKLFGAKSMWLDSIANAEELSLSGRKIGRTADIWLTQWQHLEQHSGPVFRGSVL